MWQKNFFNFWHITLWPCYGFLCWQGQMFTSMPSWGLRAWPRCVPRVPEGGRAVWCQCRLRYLSQPCAQNIRISVIWLPSNHLTKKLLSDSSCMTLKKNQRHLVSFILFVYHVIEVCEYEWWVFSAEKQQQFIVSFPVCFTKLKPIYPTITRMISQSLYVI